VRIRPLIPSTQHPWLVQPVGNPVAIDEDEEVDNEEAVKLKELGKEDT